MDVLQPGAAGMWGSGLGEVPRPGFHSYPLAWGHLRSICKMGLAQQPVVTGLGSAEWEVTSGRGVLCHAFAYLKEHGQHSSKENEVPIQPGSSASQHATSDKGVILSQPLFTLL